MAAQSKWTLLLPVGSTAPADSCLGLLEGRALLPPSPEQSCRPHNWATPISACYFAGGEPSPTPSRDHSSFSLLSPTLPLTLPPNPHCLSTVTLTMLGGMVVVLGPWEFAILVTSNTEVLPVERAIGVGSGFSKYLGSAYLTICGLQQLNPKWDLLRKQKT